MIPQIGVTIAHWLISAVNLLPNWSFPQNTLDALDLVIGYALAFDGLVPVVTMFYVLGLVLLVEGIFWITRFAISIVNWIRGAGAMEI